MSIGTATRFSETERRERLRILLTGVDRIPNALPLSVEDTLNVIGIHLACKRSWRLPALAVLAAFEAAKGRLGERVLNLTAHNAADEQTGAVGDVQITVLGDDKVVTSYEMKNKAVQRGDIDRALQKIAAQGKHVQNYIFISTESVAATSVNMLAPSMTRRAASKSRFSIASVSCATSCICFIGCVKTFSTNTRSSFFKKQTARLVRL